jgi:hypothetical protein
MFPGLKKIICSYQSALLQKGFVATAVFLGAPGIGATPTVVVLGHQHDNRPHKWHSNTSRLYKWVYL